MLSLDGTDKLAFSPGALLVLAACVCWGVENNCTRMLSQKSAAQNGQEIRFVCADVSDAPELLGRGTFTAAVMNPPYFTSGERSGNVSAALSRHAAKDALGTFLDAAFQLLDNGGRLFMVYPASELTELLCALRARRLEPKRMRFVCAKSGGEALRVLVEAKKLGRAGLVVEAMEVLET